MASRHNPAEPDLLPLQASWQCDLRDDELRWSAGVYALFDLDPDTPLRRDDIVAMYLPESRAQLRRLRDAAIADRGSFTFEAQIRRGDGQLRWIRITADVACDGDEARYLYGSKIDVTAEMAARHANPDPAHRPRRAIFDRTQAAV